MNKLGWFLVVILISVSGFSQARWTLQTCIERGSENSYQLQVSALETQVAEREKQSVGSHYLPDVGITGVHLYNFGSTIDPSTNSRVVSNIMSDQFSVDASVDLFNLQNIFRSQRQKIGVWLAQMAEDEVKYQYQTELLIRFYEVLTTQEWLAVQRQQLVNSTENLNRVQKEVEAGAKPQSDLYDIDYLSKRDEISIKETENLLYNQKLNLLHWLNEESTTPDDFELALTQELPETETEYVYSRSLRHD